MTLEELSNSLLSSQREFVTNNNQRLDEIEKKINRAGISGSAPDQSNLAADLRAFNLANAANGPALDQDGYKKYLNALDRYMRAGDRSLSSEVLNDLARGSDPSGGYWVPPDRSGRMAEILRLTSPMRQVADIQPISSDSLTGPIDNDQFDSGWVGEQDDRPDTNSAQIGQWEIPVHEQYAQPKATQQLLDDAEVNVEAWVTKKVFDLLGRKENAAFVNGDANKKPKGFLTYPTSAAADATRPWGTLQYVPTGAAASFASSNPADCLIDLVFSLKSTYRAGAAFAMNSTTAGTVRKFKDSQGRYLWQDSLQEGQPNMLLGYPVIFFEDMPDLGASNFPVAFGNWKRAYQIVDHRSGIRVLRDPFTKKGYVKFYTTKRVGGGVIQFDCLKLLKCATS